jgi:hypothetical protein
LPSIIETSEHRHMSWRRFDKLCKQQGGMMALVPSILELLDHSTDTMFLDPTCESFAAYGTYPWTIDAVRDLTAQWKVAKRYLRDFDRLTDWLKENPSRLAGIIELRNQCIETE